MSLPTVGNLPLVRVSGLAKFIAGETHCGWSLWFRSHNRRYERLPSDFDSLSWEAEHAALVRRRTESLKAEGYQTFVENQNELKLEGRTAVLVGRPDIIALRDDRAMVVDCKTGAERAAHRVQVVVYMFMLLRCRAIAGKQVYGEVYYSNASQALGPDELSPELQAHVWRAVRLAAADAPLSTVPAPRECHYCDIKVCGDRIDQREEPGADASDLF